MRTKSHSQSTIDEVPRSGEQCSATRRDLLLGMDNRRNNSGIDNTRHSRGLVGKAVKTTVLDDIQWGTFPFRPEAYVSLGMVTLRFPPYWIGSTAIMTTITLVITARGMIHFIQHQHAIVRLLAPFLCLIVL